MDRRERTRCNLAKSCEANTHDKGNSKGIECNVATFSKPLH